MQKNKDSVALTMARALALAAALAVIFCATPVFAEKVEQEDSTGTDPVRIWEMDFTCLPSSSPCITSGPMILIFGSPRNLER
jgi:hypothetical protein